MLEAFKDRAEALEGVVVIQQSLRKRLLGKASTQSFSLLDIGEGFFMRFGEGGCLLNQGGEFSLSMPSAGAQITQFPEHLASLVHEFSQFSLDV